MKHKFLLIILLLGVSRQFAQDTLILSKADFIDKVTANSYQGKVAEKQAAMAHADLEQAKALYLPRVSASYTAITTNNPLMAFGAKLNQELLTQQDFNPSLLNDPERVSNYATEFLVQQPLLNVDGIHMRNAAKIQQEAYQLKAARTFEYLAFEAAKRFMELQLAYDALEVLQSAQQTAMEAVRMVTDYYDQGMVQKADVLDAKLRANEVDNQLQSAYSQVHNTSDELLILMGVEPGTVLLKPDQEAPLAYEAASTVVHMPQNRKDLLAMEKSVAGYQSLYKSTKMKFVPRINAFGSLQLYDNQPLGFEASGYLLGARLSWDLFSGYENIAKVQKAQLVLEKASLEQKAYLTQQQAEWGKAQRMLADAKRKVELSKLALEQAQESYRIRRDRYEQGLEKTLDLLKAESQQYQQELQLRQALFEYNFSKEYLHFLTRA